MNWNIILIILAALAIMLLLMEKQKGKKEPQENSIIENEKYFKQQVFTETEKNL